MKATQTLLALAAVFGAAQADWNSTTTVVDTAVVTVPCTTLGTGTASAGFTASSNGTTYAKPTPTGSTAVVSTPTTVVTAGAGSLDARVFVGAVAAVAAIAFTL